jgi:signal transduction histidine kinase
MRSWLLRRVPGVRARVTIAAVAAVACAFAVSAAVVDATLEHDRHHVLVTTADFQAHQVAAFYSSLTTKDFNRLVNNTTVDSGLVQVLVKNKVVSASKVLREGNNPLWQPGDPVIASEPPSIVNGPARDLQRVYVPLTIKHQTVQVAVVVSLDQYDRTLGSVRRLLEFGLPILLVIVGFICWFMVGLALRRIERLRREVAEVATRPGEHRVAEPRTDDEVGRLARTLNSMLDRLEQLSMRERRFVADASHELRSPIANIRTALEVALHRPDEADWHRVAGEVLSEDGRMAHLVEDLLILARSDEGYLLPVGTSSDLLAAAQSAVELSAHTPGVEVSVAGTPTYVAVPDAYLEHIVANLVDNARRYARSAVTVTATHDAKQALLEVRDDGPGVARPDRGRIFERFVRLDEARDREHGGFGLGLAIVADLCHAYGGTIEVGDANPGAAFTVAFPLTDPRPAKPPGRADRETLAPVTS